MYFLVISYGIYAFLFHKMFIFFPQECCSLLHISIDMLIKGLGLFSIGMTCGKCLSIFDYRNKLILLIALIVMFVINIIFSQNIYFEYILSYLFLPLRFVLGMCLGVMMTWYLKHLNNYDHNTYENLLKILLNNALVAVPLWCIFKLCIPMNFWLSIISIMIFFNIIIVLFDKSLKTLNLSEKKKKSLFINISLDFFVKNGKMYMFLCTGISVVLFNALLVLLLQSEAINICNKDIVYTYLQQFIEKERNLNIVYDQLPFVLGGLSFLFPRFTKIAIWFLSPLLIINYFFIQSITLYSFLNGLIYNMYVTYAPLIAAYLKQITKDCDYSALIYYSLKSSITFILQYFFLSKLYQYTRISYSNYTWVVVGICLASQIFLLIFYKITQMKQHQLKNNNTNEDKIKS